MDRAEGDAPERKGEGLEYAQEVGPRDEASVPEDLHDTWNTDAKAWNRETSDVDPFEDVTDDDVQDDIGSYPPRAGM